MPLWVPVAIPQLWLFGVLALPFLFLVFRAMWRRGGERDTTSESKSRLGIIIQGLGIVVAATGPIHVGRPWLSPVAIASYIAIFVLVGGATAIFAASSAALGKNWSFAARTLPDHELVRRGPYARVRHPIYFGMLLFLFGIAIAYGHLLELLLGIPLFVIGTNIRTAAEDRLLEKYFGAEFEEYRRTTPSLIPRIG